jgi:hypothetical protein
MVAMFACAIHGWKHGQPDNLLIGWDADGNGCGYSKNTKDYPYLYWPQAPDATLIKDVQAGNYELMFKLLDLGTCVKSCPSETSSV